MKTKYISLLGLPLLLLGLCFYSSCTDYDIKGDTSFYDDVTIEVDGLRNDTLFINLFNEEYQLSVTVKPEDKGIVFDPKAFLYSVADESILKISESGVVSNEALGTTEISLVFRANNKVAATCQVRIWKDYMYVEELISSPVLLKIGNTYDLNTSVVVVPSVADNQVLRFESQTPDIVTVDENTGIVTTHAEGEGRIKVSSTDGSNVSTICVVNVIAEVKVSDIKLPMALNGQSVGVGQYINLGGTIEVIPSNADNKVLYYDVLEGADAISIDANGLIETIGTGSVKIIVSTTDDTDISKEISFTVNESTLINRALWTVTTETATDYGYVVDGTTGLPEHLIDDTPSTFLSLVKPGKSFGSVPAQAADFMPGFIVDMKSQQGFNYIMWRHRASNQINYLRVYGVELAGSDDGTSFTPINNSQIVWIPNAGGYSGSVSNKADANIYEIDVPESTYRYVKVSFVMWSDIYSGQHPDYAGAGATGGSSMQVSEFGVGKK